MFTICFPLGPPQGAPSGPAAAAAAASGLAADAASARNAEAALQSASIGFNISALHATLDRVRDCLCFVLFVALCDLGCACVFHFLYPLGLVYKKLLHLGVFCHTSLQRCIPVCTTAVLVCRIIVSLKHKRLQVTSVSPQEKQVQICYFAQYVGSHVADRFVEVFDLVCLNFFDFMGQLRTGPLEVFDTHPQLALAVIVVQADNALY